MAALVLSSVGGSEMVVDQRCDGKTGFASNSLQGDREMTGEQLQHMLNATFPSPLLNYKEAGTKIELAGRETVGAKPVIVLQYTPAAGPASKLYLDAETFLLTRQTVKLNVPEAGGAVEQTTDVTDYRLTDGVKTPFSVTVSGAGQLHHDYPGESRVQLGPRRRGVQPARREVAPTARVVTAGP